MNTTIITGMESHTDKERDPDMDWDVITPLLSHRQTNFEVGIWSQFPYFGIPYRTFFPGSWLLWDLDLSGFAGSKGK